MQQRLYAHRGAAAELPENTIPSFARALEYGAHALEMDVHASSDGVIVVSHDADGRRMCGKAGRIANTSYATLRQWDAGWGFTSTNGDRPFVGAGYQIPRLEEVLEAFPDICINVDIKARSSSVVSKVFHVVRNARAESRVQLASFSPITLLQLRCTGYQGITAMSEVELVAALFAPTWMIAPWPLRGRAAQIPTLARGITLATPSRIAKLHALDVRVDFWTINDVEQARRLLAMGADGIMSDDPRAIAPAFVKPQK